MINGFTRGCRSSVSSSIPYKALRPSPPVSDALLGHWVWQKRGSHVCMCVCVCVYGWVN